MEAIDNFEQFLLVDLPSKIFPKDETLSKLKGENWYRVDSFKDKKEVKEYIEGHFDIFRKELIKKDEDGK